MSENTVIPAKKASIVDFFKGVMLELKRVDWPSKDKTIRLTLIVIAVSLIMGVFVGGLDIAFTKLVESLLALKK
jgi:preprotein translocase subunit SecE